MSLSTGLATLKASQLKYAAFHIGIPSTGAKAQLELAIRNRLSASPRLDEGSRILSVDMGIKNLGVCVLETPPMDTRNSGVKAPVRVVTWKRMDVLNRMVLHTGDTPAQSASRRGTKRSTQPAIDSTAFKPSRLSRTAVGLAEELLQEYKPTHLLIERQRFRSGGAAAVQEWTLRVNMLESMLWAAFESFRRNPSYHDLVPATYEIDPARVARFWCAPGPGYQTMVPNTLLSEVPEGSRLPDGSARGAEKVSVDKRQKIALVRSWLSASSSDGRENVALEFSKGAQQAAAAFLPGNRMSNRKSAGTVEQPLGTGLDKLDDLADCLLQGLAWVRWTENVNSIGKLLGREGGNG